MAELVATEQARFRAIGGLRAALPQHELVLRADTQQRLAELSAARAAEVREDIDSYLRQHPETAQALFQEA